MIEIKGFITNIIYDEGDNNFKIFQIDQKVTVKGRLFFDIEKGKEILCEGVFDTNGDFLAEKSFEYIISEEDIISEILSFGAIKGVGRFLSKKIVEEFKKDTFYIIERRPNELTKIDGISNIKAKEIRNSWIKIKDAKKTLEYLIKKGFTANTSMLLYKKYKSMILSKMDKNPYIALTVDTDMSFSDIDNIAVYKFYIEPISNLRVKEAILYILNNEHKKSGNTIIDINRIISNSSNIIKVDSKIVISMINALKNNKKIFIYKIQNTKYVQDSKYRESEVYISNWIREQNSKIKIKLKESEFVNFFNKNNLSIILGDFGSGKTHLVGDLVKDLKKEGLSYEIVAFSGSRVSSLKNIYGLEAKTVHKLLDYNYEKESFLYNENNKIYKDVFIIHSFEAIDTILFFNFLKAIPNNSKIVLVGNIFSLPSVGVGNLLKDLMVSKRDSVFVLNKIFKNKNSSILINCNNKINELIKNENVTLIESASDIESKEKARDIIKNFKEDNFFDYQIIVPTNKGVVGVSEMNLMVKSIVNPQKYKNKKNVPIEAKDKVIQTKNNYNKNIYNGEFAYVNSINDYEVEILLNKETISLDRVEFSSFIMGYASTVHKSQGNHFNTTIFILPENGSFVNYEMIKVALATAKNKIYIIGSPSLFKKCCENKNKIKRKTLLKSFLK